MSRDTMPDVSALITAAEWLSDVFGAPPSPQRVAHAATPQGQEALRWIGDQLDAPAEAQALCRVLAQQAPDSLAVHLQRRYTALFEGIFQHRAVLPYESAWQAGATPLLGGTPVAEMEATLRALDLHVDKACCEPPDHLAIELATLSVALRGGQDAVAADLVSRLRDWVPGFSAALHQQDPDGFYATAGDLLLALIRKAAAVLAIIEPAAAPVTERREGESA